MTIAEHLRAIADEMSEHPDDSCPRWLVALIGDLIFSHTRERDISIFRRAADLAEKEEKR